MYKTIENAESQDAQPAYMTTRAFMRTTLGTIIAATLLPSKLLAGNPQRGRGNNNGRGNENPGEGGNAYGRLPGPPTFGTQVDNNGDPQRGRGVNNGKGNEDPGTPRGHAYGRLPGPPYGAGSAAQNAGYTSRVQWNKRSRMMAQQRQQKREYSVWRAIKNLFR